MQCDELLKAKLLEVLKSDSDICARTGKPLDDLVRIFDRVWTACSCMDGNLLDHMHALFKLKEHDGDHWWELDSASLSDPEDEIDPRWTCKSVVLDFQNFLMHVLRLYLGSHGREDVPLDERQMPDLLEDATVVIEPLEFLQLLVKTRLNFDMYVVKMKMGRDHVVGWRLEDLVRRPGSESESDTYAVANSYGRENCAKLMCLQSALEVSSPESRNKEWVFAILSASDSDRKNSIRMIEQLEAYARRKLVECKNEIAAIGADIYASGKQTPRLFMNFIDYLMSDEDPMSCFVFKYDNSVGCLHPRHDDQEEESWLMEEIDEIGNLFLTSSSDELALSDAPAAEKVRGFRRNNRGAMPDNPKRNLMYNQTEEGGWTREKMQALTRDVKRLMEEFLSK